MYVDVCIYTICTRMYVFAYCAYCGLTFLIELSTAACSPCTPRHGGSEIVACRISRTLLADL